jgi:GNAT superfamily N-acetyltransferase
MIRQWTAADQDALLPLIQDCLRVNYEAGADMQPTLKNACALFAVGLQAAGRGEPCLVATVEGEIAAYTLWCELPNPLGLDFRQRVLHGLGTYVCPAYRGVGLSHHIRNVAEAQGGRLGFDKVVGIAYHDAGLSAVRSRNYQVTGTQVEKELAR